MAYAGAEFWDQFFRRRLAAGDDLDWAAAWTEPVLVPHRKTGEPFKHVWRGTARR